MKWVKIIAILLITTSVCITVFFVETLKPTSAGAFLFFAVWLILPYLSMILALLILQRKKTVSVYWYISAVFVSIGGVVFLADVIFWNSDAQGAIAVLMTPLLQAVIFAIFQFIAPWILKNAHA